MKEASPHIDNKQRLDSVNRFLNTCAQWTPLQASGTTNDHFRAIVGGKALILRLNATEHYSFGVSRKVEANILELIKAYSWSPQVIKNNWQDGWCLMLDHGPVMEAELLPGGHQEITSALLDAISEWQLIRPDNLLINKCMFDYHHLFKKYRNVFKTISSNATSQNNHHLIDQIEIKLNALPSVPHCLTHHDLHPENICKGDSQLVVLDWEYAGIGNPWFDAAALQSRFGVLTEDIAALPAFKELNNAQLKQGLDDATVLAKTLDILWFEVRQT